MAIKSFNSIAGFSVNDTNGDAYIIIDRNGNVTTPDLTVTEKSNLGSVSNVYISGGTIGQFLQTDGTGNLTFETIVSVAGSNTQIQFNDDGAFGASSSFTFDKISSVASLKGNLSLVSSSDSNYVGFSAPSVVTGNVIWTLPPADASIYGAVLASDATGNLYFRNTSSNLAVGTRTGQTYVELINGYLFIETRTGNVPVPVS